jgi:hypothetical protein
MIPSPPVKHIPNAGPPLQTLAIRAPCRYRFGAA